MASAQSIPIDRQYERDFSLMLGGPLYQLFCRVHLCGHVLEMVKRRVLVLFGIAWVPLLFLSGLNGTAWGGAVQLPFLADVEAYARFIIAMPLLIIAELVVHQRMRPVVYYFVESGLVPERERQKFDAVINSALRLRNSVTAEVVLIALVYLLDVLVVWRGHLAIDAGSWHGTVVDGELRPSVAGWWFRCVSLPLLQFLLVRWYYRLFIWTRLLWQTSRLDLDLIPSHPDRSAGLGFLTLISYALTPLLLAQGALVAGVLADRIFFTGAKLPQFKPEIVALVILSVLIVVGPLLVFAPRLAKLKRLALREYGILAQRYTGQFHEKWIRGGAGPAEPLLGSSDIQSLADLSNSFDIIKEMRSVPFTPRALVRLLVAAVVPILPLLLTMIPAEELLQRLMKVVF
jgi:hypothetical protein